MVSLTSGIHKEGFTLKAVVNQGLRLGGDGGDLCNHRTDRGVYPQGTFVIGNYGANRNRTYQAFLNSELPVSDNVTASCSVAIRDKTPARSHATAVATRPSRLMTASVPGTVASEHNVRPD